jgi:hypothetical protein
MSRLRQRAVEVRAEGAARRQIRNPSADSPAYQRYAWWLARTGTVIQRENFCHYWRVALIWAPLRKLADKLAFLVRPLAYLVTSLLAALVVALATYGVYEFFQADGGFWHKLGKAVLVLLGLAWFVGGFLLAIMVLVPLMPDATASPSTAQPPSRRTKVLAGTGVLLTLPVFLAVGLLLVLFLAVEWAAEKRIVPRAINWLGTAHFADSKWFGWVRPAYAFPAVLVGLSVVYTWARWSLLVVVGLAVIASLLLGLAYLADQRKERDAQRREERYQYYLAHPKARCAPAKPTVPRQPGRFDHFLDAVALRFNNALNGVVDFLALVWSIVLVKKWGVCPYVELPTQSEGELRNSGTVQEA